MWTKNQLVEALDELRFRGSDSTFIEVKEAHEGFPKNLGETLSAFANMPEGGTIVFGVSEKNNFSVIGVYSVKEVESNIASLARNALEPAVTIETQSFSVGGLAIVVVHVFPLPMLDKPAQYKGVAYLRQSDGDYPMSVPDLRMIEVAKYHEPDVTGHDLTPVPETTISDLDPKLKAQYLAARRQSRRLRELDDTELLRVTGVCTAQGELTLAGLYAMGMYPQGLFPSLQVTAAVQVERDGSGVRTRMLETFDGPVPALLDDLLGWVRRILPKEQHYDADGNLRDVYVYPINAIRELIGNALVHRDLGPNTVGYGKSIQIRLTPENRLIIQSPGGLRGLTVQQLESAEHAQAAVNQRLYEIAKVLTTADGARIIEGEGGGLREVILACREQDLPRPHFVNTGVQFRVELHPRVSYSSNTHNVEETTESFPSKLLQTRSTKYGDAIVEALTIHETLTIRELATELQISVPQIRYALQRLIREGVVVQLGGQGYKGTTYSLMRPV